MSVVKHLPTHMLGCVQIESMVSSDGESGLQSQVETGAISIVLYEARHAMYQSKYDST